MQNQSIEKKEYVPIFFTLILGVAALFSLIIPVVYASETDGTIVTGGNAGYAWSDQAGWVNFGVANGNIHITDSGITGYAWNSGYGWINMAPTNGGVTVAANGALSGYAWGSSFGWINFSGVSINSAGKFIGNATGTVIGTLTFDCDNCSVVTDYRPQNFRTTTPAPVSSGGGGGGGGGGGIPYVSGPSGQAVPAHIDAFNVPMKLFPAQSGTLTQNLTNQKTAILDIPNNISSDEITFIIQEEEISQSITTTIQVVGNSVFRVTAWDRANNPVHSFLKPIKITFNIPELLRGRSDLGVYFFDDAAKVWVKIPDAVFSADSVSFYVSHLTLFAIFSPPAGQAGATELPPTIESPFPLPAEPGLPAPQTEVRPLQEKTAAPEVTSKEAPPLFDVEIGPGPATSKKNITYYIIAAIGIIAAGIAIYILRRIKKRRQEGEI